MPGSLRIARCSQSLGRFPLTEPRLLWCIRGSTLPGLGEKNKGFDGERFRAVPEARESRHARSRLPDGEVRGQRRRVVRFEQCTCPEPCSEAGPSTLARELNRRPRQKSQLRFVALDALNECEYRIYAILGSTHFCDIVTNFHKKLRAKDLLHISRAAAFKIGHRGLQASGVRKTEQRCTEKNRVPLARDAVCRGCYPKAFTACST